MAEKTFARVVDGSVAELVTADRPMATLFHPGIVWAEVTGKPVAVGWRETPAGFAPPPAAPPPAAPTLAEVQAQFAALAVKLAALG